MIKEIFYIFKFIKHNKKIFKKKNYYTENIILIENYNHKPSLIAYSYFANILRDIHNAKLIVYDTNFLNWKTFVKNFIQVPFFNNYNIFKSFNVVNKLTPTRNNNQNLANNLYFQNLKKIKNKRDILNIKFFNIKIGDLIYDEYLRKFNLPTIDINSEHFKNYFYSFVELFVFWHTFFKNNKVKAVMVSHTVYALGIVARIANFRGIKAYNVSLNYAYSLSKKNYLRLSGFEKFHTNFLKIKKLLKKDLIQISKNSLNRKILGKDAAIHKIESNIPASVFQNNKSYSRKNEKKEKILVATHCFTDAVHAYGNALFPDFYEWLSYLGELSNKINYEWLIKIHPAEYDKNKLQINKFIQKYKKFSLLDKEITHNKIIAENNILCALTVYGSIGHEYPLFGIPVINASVNNPYKAYKFNYNPSSIKKYEYLIRNANKLKNNFNNRKNEIYEYYYISGFLSEYHLFKNPYNVIRKLGKNYSNSLVYGEWLKQFNSKFHKKRMDDYTKFIKSNKFRMHAYNANNNSKYLEI
jgi:hypothetical protein